jgi:ABC-type transport system involved in multi-copper enzyme maturation permease subunit
MPILSTGYRHWEGVRRGRPARILSIARCGIKLALAKRGLITVILFSLIPACLVGVLIYYSTQMAEFLKQAAGLMALMSGSDDWRTQLGNAPTTADAWKLIFSVFYYWELLPVGVIITYVGPELISQDLRARALQIYYSRPLTRIDYILGKLIVVAVFVSMVTFIPATLLYIMGVLLTSTPATLLTTYPSFLAILGGYLLLAGVGGVLVLTCSSLSRRSGYVAIAWALLVVMSDVVYMMLHATLPIEGKWAVLFSIRGNISQAFTWLFSLPRAYDFDRAASFFVLGALVIVAFTVLYRRLKSLEGEH